MSSLVTVVPEHLVIFNNQRAFQDELPFFVPLSVLVRVLIHPAYLRQLGSDEDGCHERVSNLFNSVNLCYQSSLQDHFPFLVPLLFLCRILIHPPYSTLTLLARDIPNNMSSSEHDTVLFLAHCQVYHLLEEERAPCGPRESGREEVSAVCQHCAALCAGV